MAFDFAAGCLGGCAGIMVGYPLDTVKVHIQTQDHKNPKYKGTWHCFRTIVARDSIAGLYRGMSSPMTGVAVVNAIVFGVYGTTQKTLADSEHLGVHFLAGATAGLAQTPVCSPIELAKTRLQLQSSIHFSSPLQCLKHIYKVDGYRGISSGMGITFMREIPSYGIYFFTYEALTRSTSHRISTLHMLFAGGLAGTASWVFTYPLDVIKSRLQADISKKYSGTIDCFRKSVRAEGYNCLFRGLSSTILRAFPTNAATFTVVNWTFRLFSTQPIQEAEKPPVEMFHVVPALETYANECGLILNNFFDLKFKIKNLPVIGNTIISHREPARKLMTSREEQERDIVDKWAAGSNYNEFRIAIIS